MSIQFYSRSDYAESWKTKALVVVLVQVIGHGKSVLSRRTDNIGLHAVTAVIHYLCLKGLSAKEVNEDMVVTLGEEGEDIIAALAHFLTVQDATFNNEGICILHYRFSFDFYISP